MPRGNFMPHDDLSSYYPTDPNWTMPQKISLATQKHLQQRHAREPKHAVTGSSNPIAAVLDARNVGSLQPEQAKLLGVLLRLILGDSFVKNDLEQTMENITR